MQFDYSKLRGRIIEKFGSIRGFANHLDLQEQLVGKKLLNQVKISQPDIIKWSEALDIDQNDIGVYFFKLKP